MTDFDRTDTFVSPDGRRFLTAARTLLTAVRLRAGGSAFRIVEVEAYDHSPDHPDPFVHRHPVQEQPDRWYLHRVGRGFRGGSFKGIDLTFGAPGTFRGWLIRSIESDDGRLVEGPSLVVDRLLEATGTARPADLHVRIGDRDAGSPGNPVRWESVEAVDRPIACGPRVGLKGTTHDPVRSAFRSAPYRYTTEARRLRKGRGAWVDYLIEQGWSDERIVALLGVRELLLQRRRTPVRPNS